MTDSPDINLMEYQIKYAELCTKLRTLDVSEEHINRIKTKGIKALESAVNMLEQLHTYYAKDIEKELNLI